MAAPKLTVVGSINLDLVVRAERLPRAGETVSGASFSRGPGGKGANQAVAAARLGAEVRMVGAVGSDAFAGEALNGLREAGVRDRWLPKDAPTGVALITVDAAGRRRSSCRPARTPSFGRRSCRLLPDEAVLCQQEIPAETVARVAEVAPRFFLNAAPARAGAPDAEADDRQPARARGARRSRRASSASRSAPKEPCCSRTEPRSRAPTPPPVEAVDGTGAGDAFTACLVVSLLEGRDREEALRRACIAGALAASRPGAQSSMPTAEEVDALL